MSSGERPADPAIPQQALLAAIVTSSDDAILSKSLDGIILSWNAGAERMFGYAAHEVVGRSIMVLVPPERAAEEASILERLRSGAPVRALETVRLTKDGRRIDVSLTSSPVLDPSGAIVGASKIVRDISASKRAAQALVQSRSRLAGIVDSAMDAIITVDDEGRIVLFNGAAAAMFGCPSQDAEGTPLERFIPPRFRSGHGTWMRRFGASGSAQRRMGLPGEIWALRADGSEFPVSASISHIEIEGHELYTVIMRDLSELKHAQAERRALEIQLQEAQKMEAIGTLAGGIAHDFNNIVASIIGNVGLARDELDAAHPASAYLQQVDQAASRARAVIRQILAFSRRQPRQLVNQPLRPMLDEAMTLLRVTLPAIVRLESKFMCTDVHVLADATQIHQVLLNLCTNAWHALQGSSGRVEVGLDEIDLDGAGAALLGLIDPGRYAHVWVSDNGAGIEPAVRARIFEPFFTTKPQGEGTGLGLSVVHGIVTDHRGAVSVDSVPGRGSTFHVYLPAQAAAAIVPPAGSVDDAAAPASGCRVLYIDDDEVMVLMVERLLKRRGYHVVSSQNPREALAALVPGTFDIVVTDYNMPDCNGLEVAEQVRRTVPGLPVIVSSGYVPDELRKSAKLAGVSAILEKEATFEDLPGLIGRVLAGAA